MKESYREDLANDFGLGPYAGDGNIAGVASARGNAGQPLSSENITLVCRRRPDVRKATRQLPLTGKASPGSNSGFGIQAKPTGANDATEANN